MTSAAPEMGLLVGSRLAEIRAGRSQPARAGELGVHKNTYARWERGETGVSAEGLAALALEGWNTNWVLTGQGPKRTEQLPSMASDEQTAAEFASHPERAEIMKIAVELIDSELARAARVLPPEKRAVAYLLVFDLLLEPGNVLPSAKVVQLAIKAAV